MKYIRVKTEEEFFNDPNLEFQKRDSGFFRVGDNPVFTPPMNKYCGAWLAVPDIIYHNIELYPNSDETFRINTKEDPGRWSWANWMFSLEPYDPTKKYSLLRI